jgi:ribonucleoside-diphosphate reductase beta chain
MTDVAAAEGKIQETQVHRYRSTRGINHDSVAWKLWEKSKKLFWDPADIDWSHDAEDWASMTDEQRLPFALSARGFMVGEEAVTMDIVPLLRAMSDLGRLEDTMYLTMFVMEEAKHTDMFRRWFDTVDFDPSSLDDFIRMQTEQARANGARPRGLFDGELTKVMQRLDTDHSPEAMLDATLVYNHLVEGVAAIGGYYRWNLLFRATEKLPGLEQGIKMTRRDESRHISYGTYLARRIIAENPELWDFVERRWAELTEGFGQGAYSGPAQARLGYNPEYIENLIKRRLAALAVARSMSVEDVDNSSVVELVPEELTPDLA